MNKIANALLESKAVHIKPNPEEFFTWTSGKRSPIYCDNRQLISHPNFRKEIVLEFTKVIKEKYKDVELIAGTATAGIPWAAWIADALELPMVYIRSKAKGHGLKTAIEGNFKANQKTLIIEDLISTGKSSIEAFDHTHSDGLNTLAVLSIFNYDFKLAKENFKAKDLEYFSLCTIQDLLSHAKDSQLLSTNDVKTVLNWRETF